MIVVDASIAFKWYAEGEPDFAAAFRLLEAHLLKKQVIIAPELLLYELANAWSTKARLDEKQAKLNLQNFRDARIQIQPYTFERIAKAIEFSKQYHVSVYDASYAILAKEKGCTLITADSKFVQQVNLSFVHSLGTYTA